MKKFTLALLAVLLIGFSNTKAQDVKIGIKAGASLSFLSGDNLSVDPSFKYHGGALVNLSFTEVFSIQPEVLYSAKGANGKDFDIDMNYIEVPILAKVKVLGFSIHAGPQFGYLLNSESKITLPSGDTKTEDYKDKLKSFDLSGAAGLEYITVVGLSFGARYTFSLTSIGKDYDQVVETEVNGVKSTVTTVVSDPNFKTGVIQVFVAFQF